MKVGLFGGLFDPPHIGHLILGQHVLEEFHLDKLQFVPAGNPPHKRDYSPYETRYTMTQLAIADNDCFAVSDIEREIQDKTYTIDMVRALQQKAEDEYYLIIGSDQWLEIETWKDPEGLFRECRIVVMRRLNYDISKESRFFDRILISTAPLIDISSTTIRARIRKGSSVRYLIAPSVAEYIATHNLYRD